MVQFLKNAEQEKLYNEIISKYNFNGEQEKQIRYGIIFYNVDIFIYAKPEYTEWQMEQIRIGLEHGIDVSWYAKPEFN